MTQPPKSPSHDEIWIYQRKMLESYEINDRKAATIEESVVKEVWGNCNWGIGEEDGQAKPAMTLWDTTNTNSGQIPYI